MTPAKFAVLVLGSASLLLDWTASASAQSCSDTSPCPRGFACEVTAVSRCAAPDVMPEAACDGGTCGAANPAPPKPPECMQQEYRSCVPGPCMADGDCASGMVCYEQRTGGCTAPAAGPCMPGSNCGAFAPAPPTCMPTVERMCVPRYLLPCAQANDCGAGFTCEPQEQCGCSGGSAGAGAPLPTAPAPTTPPQPAQDAGQADPALPTPTDGGVAERPSQPLPPECSCKPTEEKYCKPIEVDCTTDGQCPAMWKCSTIATSGSRPACMVPPPGVDGGTCAAPPPPVEIRRCTPPYDGINVGVSHGGDTPVMRPSAGTPGQGRQPGLVPPQPVGSVPPVSTPAPTAPSAQNENADAPVHTEACSVMHVGANERDGGLELWASLLSLAAAWFATRRRR